MPKAAPAKTHEDKRQALLDAALDLFVERGFHATPTAAISKRAGVATGTLFHHFPDKNTLINALYLEIKGTVASELNRRIPQSGPLKDRLHRVWTYVVEWSLQHPKELQFMMLFDNSPLISQITQKKAQELFNSADDLIEEGRKSGVFKPLSRELIKSLFKGVTMTMVKYALSQGKTPQKRILETSFEFIWDGLSSHT